MKKLGVFKLREEAVLPAKAHTTDAGIDIYGVLERREVNGEEIVVPMLFNAQSQMLVDTGIAFDIPEGYGLILKDRSSFGSKGITVRAGVIDEGYTGEVKVALANTNHDRLFLLTNQDRESFKEAELLDLADGMLKTMFEAELTQEEFEEKINNYEVVPMSALIVKHIADPIAQGLLVEVPKVEIVELDANEFGAVCINKDRKANGFGSTNVEKEAN